MRRKKVSKRERTKQKVVVTLFFVVRFVARMRFSAAIAAQPSAQADARRFGARIRGFKVGKEKTKCTSFDLSFLQSRFDWNRSIAAQVAQADLLFYGGIAAEHCCQFEREQSDL